MIPEIILAEQEYTTETKERTITVKKRELVEDINALTYKFANRVMQGSVAQGLVATDTQDNLDGTIISRFMVYRDSIIRRKMRFAMTVENINQADDEMNIGADFVYNLTISVKYPDSDLPAVAQLIHRYIVWGTLYDYYLNIGLMDQAQYYKAEVNAIEQEIIDNLRTPSRVKKPLQPFGPRKKGGLF